METIKSLSDLERVRVADLLQKSLSSDLSMEALLTHMQTTLTSSMYQGHKTSGKM